MTEKNSGRDDSLSELGKSDATRSALRKSISRAVETIETRLGENTPKIPELARIAGISRSHFQAAFRAVVGESVSQHIMRLRIERGASLLKYSSWQAGEIALVCGYKTQTSFTRDFKKHYGLTPQQFRKANGTIPYLRGHLRSRPGQELENSNLPIPTARIESWPDLHAICFRVYSSPSDLHRHWKEALRKANEFVDLDNSRFFGLWFDEWAGDGDPYRYECAIVPPLPVPEAPPAPFTRRVIPAGDVAIAQAQGREKELDLAWRAFATGWLPFSGFQPRLEYGMDEYPKALASKSFLSKVPLLWNGISLSMCLPVQTKPLEL